MLTGQGPVLPLLVLVATRAVVLLLASRLARDANTIAEPTGTHPATRAHVLAQRPISQRVAQFAGVATGVVQLP